MSKFMPEDIKNIRDMADNGKYKLKEIAEVYKTDSGVISRIVNRKKLQKH